MGYGFNSKDGAIDRQIKLHVGVQLRFVSIPKMVRLIVSSLFSLFHCF